MVKEYKRHEKRRLRRRESACCNGKNSGGSNSHGAFSKIKRRGVWRSELKTLRTAQRILAGCRMTRSSEIHFKGLVIGGKTIKRRRTGTESD